VSICEFLVAKLDGECSDLRIDGDDVSIAQQTNRTSNSRFRSDVANAEAAGPAGEAAVGN
jgi:hypothetical protein